MQMYVPAIYLYQQRHFLYARNAAHARKQYPSGAIDQTQRPLTDAASPLQRKRICLSIKLHHGCCLTVFKQCYLNRCGAHGMSL